MKYADLHVHTLSSDGTYTVDQLIKGAVKAKLSAISITDHDTTEAIAEAIAKAEGNDLEIIPGIELTTQHQNQEIHILGYFIDYQNSILLEKLKSIRQDRIDRVYQIIKNLGDLGIKLSPETVFEISGNAIVGRMHIARAMVKEGCVGTIFEAFQKYIGDKSPAYVLGFRLTVEEGIKIINDAGGLAVLAHPYLLHDDELIAEFIRYGLDGIEVYYPEHSQSMINHYRSLASEYNLFVTGGSDFHGSAKPQIKLGTIKLPMDFVQKLRLRKND